MLTGIARLGECGSHIRCSLCVALRFLTLAGSTRSVAWQPAFLEGTHHLQTEAVT